MPPLNLHAVHSEESQPHRRAAGRWADREVLVAVNLSATDLDDEELPHRIH